MKLARRHVWFLLAIGLPACLLCGGCATENYLNSRRIRENALNHQLKLVGYRGPQVSQRTWNTLRRYDLDEQYQSDHNQCFEYIRDRINDNPDAELIYALSELSYVEGKRAEKGGNINLALDHYGASLTNGYDYLFSPDLAQTRNIYDPQFRAACDLYNESLEDTLRLLCADNHVEPGKSYKIKTANREFIVRTAMRGRWEPDEFDHYEFVSDYEIDTLRNRHTTYGIGVPLIAVRRPRETDSATGDVENFYPQGLSYAVTALMRCVPPSENQSPDAQPNRLGQSKTCLLEFFDPLSANQIQLSQQWVPLQTDLTTPLAFFLDSPEFRNRNGATEGLLNPAGSVDKRGLYMLEPYDPDRIPVLMVHGLWSSPSTWMDMFNDLRSFPEIRERYQFWFYLYPSGQPFWISAAQLREELQQMRQTADPDRRDPNLDQMVLVGHSMGGLISRMQTIDSGDDFWKIISNAPVQNANQAFDQINGQDEDRNHLVSTLFFKPNSSIRRVVTIGTPHRGSEFANDVTRWIARRIIRLPTRALSIGQRLATNNPQLFKNAELLTVANAIDSLAPESPIFPAMLRAKKAPNVKYHNIIGVLKNPSLIRGQLSNGDGVVAYESASMDDTESELLVDEEHAKIHMTSKAIFEVRRILLTHLHELDANDSIASNESFPQDAKAPSDTDDRATFPVQSPVVGDAQSVPDIRLSERPVEAARSTR